MSSVKIGLHGKQHIVKKDGMEVLKYRQHPSMMTSHWLFRKAEELHLERLKNFIYYNPEGYTRDYDSSPFSEPNQLMSITVYHANIKPSTSRYVCMIMIAFHLLYVGAYYPQ